MNKPLIILCALLCVSLSIFSQNNNCAGAIGLTIGTPVTGTVVGSTLDGTTNSCTGTERYDVWYTFVATKGSHTVTLTGLGSNFSSPSIQILSGSCSGTSLACGTTSATANGLNSGQTYYVRVFYVQGSAATAPASNGGFTITVLTPNDNCANATTVTPALTCGALAAQSLYFATADVANLGNPNPYANANTTYDVWYKFTAPANVTTVRIALPSRGGNISNSNTFIEAFKPGACGTFTAANSLGTANNTGNGLNLINILPGTEYYFRVFTTTNPDVVGQSSNWNFTVCVSYEAAPGNDDCSNATALTVGSTTTSRLNNATASADAIASNCATDNPDDDVWFRFNATSSTAKVTVLGSASVNAAGASVQILSGSCGSFTSLACGNRGSAFASGLSVGTQYYVRVYTEGAPGTGATGGVYNNNSFTNGGFSITVSGTPPSTLQTAGRMKEVFKQTILSPGGMLLDPWDVTVGPDNFLWITEAKGYKLYRMDPNTGQRSTILDLTPNSKFFTSDNDRLFNLQYDASVQSGQGGFAGLALHPKLLDPVSPVNSVYVSYIYTYNYTAANSEGKFFTNRIVKFTYNPTTNKLESPEAVCDTLPGSSDHNSQRMTIAPVGSNYYLFYAAGDMGAGQFENRMRPMKAQDPTAYEGKILRFNLVSDGDAGLDKWIPFDNPFNTTSPDKQSAVWATGIRNNQGFAYDTTTQTLYGTSHGPYSDDEINIIERGRNYGHPLVIGYRLDENYAGSSAGANNGSTCPIIVSEITNAATIGASYKDPLFTAYPRTQSEVNTIYSTNPGNGGWPSEGWSGLDIYKANYAPGWKNSLIVASLKWGRILRFKLGAAGNTLLQSGGADTIANFDSQNRFRDIAFSRDGKDMFVIMDRSSATSGPSADNPSIVSCPGCVQKYTFLGYYNVAGTSSIDSSIDVTAPLVNNTCTPGTTITINSDNSNLWVPITGPDGNIMAEILANGQNLGQVTSSFYKNSGALRQRNGKQYLDRNITITPAVQPSSPVKIRLYISKSEFETIAAQTLIDTITQLIILKNDDNCGSSLASNTLNISTTHYRHGPNGFALEGEINSFSSFYFAASLITLPLELVTFKGELVNNATILDWETTNEKNTDKFIIERSIDGRTFEDIGSVAAAGNSSSRLNYSYIDNAVTTLASTTIYYRLRMISQDQKFDYSNTIKVTLNDNRKITLFPSPATTEVKVSITTAIAGDLKWKLVDNAGLVVMQGVAKMKAGKNILPLQISHLAAGVYHVNLSGAGVDQSVKFQKL